MASNDQENDQVDVKAITLSEELKKYENMRVRVEGELQKLRDEIVERLPKSCKMVKSKADKIVVVVMHTNRLEVDAKEALSLAGLEDGDKDKTILVIFQVSKSQTVKDESFTTDDVCKIIYEPWYPSTRKSSIFVRPLYKVWLVIMVWFVGACWGWYLRCYFDFPACISGE